LPLQLPPLTVSVSNTTLSIDGSNNRVGIGTTTPSVPLEINNGTTAGALKISINRVWVKVLTSDPNGVATWSTTVVTAFANAWTPASGTLVNPFTGAAGGPFNTDLIVVIPEKGWYFSVAVYPLIQNVMIIFSTLTVSGCMEELLRLQYRRAFMFPRDQESVLYFANVGTYTVFAGKTNLIVPTTFNAKPCFLSGFCKISKLKKTDFKARFFYKLLYFFTMILTLH
jgi:hypothetical protein